MTIEIPWSRTKRKKSVRTITQTEVAECGLACLSMVAGAHGLEADLASLRRRFPASDRGTSMAELVRIASSLGLKARAFRAEPADLSNLSLPAILHWGMNHFVVLDDIRRHSFSVADPARGRSHVSHEEFGRKFTGVALELAPTTTFNRTRKKKRTSWRDVTGTILGLKRAALQVLGLAVAAEIFGLFIPLQIRWIVDKVLVTNDHLLLWTISGSLAALAIAQASLSVLRGFVLSWVGISFCAQWTSNMFTHLMRLPMEFFGRRHMGDVVSRFASAKSIQTTLTGSFVEVCLNGIVGVMALSIMAILFSPQMTIIVIGGFTIYAAMRLFSVSVLWRYTEAGLGYSAQQQSELMESIRGIQTIKLAVAEPIRVSRLDNLTIAAAHQDLSVQRISASFRAANQGLFTLTRIAFITAGAFQCMAGKISAGTLVAFVAYADQFIQRGGALLDKIVDFRLLDLHANRVADIVLSEPENVGLIAGPTPPSAAIQIENLGFRYSDTDPYVFRNVSLSIKEGESVAIVGPSGCGKTTLAKVLLGLLRATEGEISVGGIPMSRMNHQSFRRMVGAVMQDDHLFAGTIASNVCFFDDGATPHDIESACIAAGIHGDIVRMPMGYETLVGDMGSSLSGGQKQRVLLARALYSKPRILVLDEATSHLDVCRESQINEKISSLKITRILIAHRESTIQSADRIIDLAGYG